MSGSSAVTAGLGAARAVLPRKALEQTVGVSFLDPESAVPDDEPGVSTCPLQHGRNRAAGRGILHGVIQKNGNQLADGFLIPGHLQAGRSGQLKILPLRARDRLKGPGCFFHQLRQGKVLHLLRQVFLLHLGQVDEVCGERGEAAGLPADVGDPLVFSFALQLRFQHVCIRLDDRDRGFQLVSGIGDKALLLFIALRNRPHDPLGKQQQEQKDAENAEEGDPDAGIQKASEGAQLSLAVEKQQQGLRALRLRATIAVSVRKTLLPALGIDRRGERPGFVLGQRREVVQVDGHVSLAVKTGREIAGLIRKLAEAAAPVAEWPFPARIRNLFPVGRCRRILRGGLHALGGRDHLCRLILRPEHLAGKAAAVLRQDFQRAVRVADQTAEVEHIDRTDQQQQDEKDRRDRSEDEFLP